MIKDRVIVRRYAQVFVSSARKAIGLPQVLADIHALRDLVRDNPDFKDFLESAEFSILEKYDLIDRVLSGYISQETRNFLKFLLEKKRCSFFLDIAEYIRIEYAHEGEEEVLLKTSMPLDLDLLQQLKDKLQKKFHKNLKLYIEIDGNLLGGVQVMIGNIILDGSIKKRFTELRERLKATEVG